MKLRATPRTGERQPTGANKPRSFISKIISRETLAAIAAVYSVTGGIGCAGPENITGIQQRPGVSDHPKAWPARGSENSNNNNEGGVENQTYTKYGRPMLQLGKDGLFVSLVFGQEMPDKLIITGSQLGANGKVLRSINSEVPKDEEGKVRGQVDTIADGASDACIVVNYYKEGKLVGSVQTSKNLKLGEGGEGNCPKDISANASSEVRKALAKASE